MPLVLAIGCFADPPPLVPGDGDGDEGESVGDDGESTDGMGGTTNGDATQGSGSASSSSTSTASASTGTTDGDTSTDDDTTGTTDDTSQPCGDLGQPCCDTMCGRGECRGGTCIAFLGAYENPVPCEGCQAVEHLPTLAGCDCEEFVTTDPFVLHADTCMQELPFIETHMRMCQAELDDDLTGSDWGGAYLTVVAALCAEIEDPCTVPNAYTGTCSCPPEMDAIAMGVRGPCAGGGGSAGYELVLCSSNATAPITFGGAYETLDGNPPVCHVGNPRAGHDCACPGGFVAQGLRIINTVDGYGGTVHFCMGAP